jgi:TRAP-type C4-dicarboxylate transport system permease small subunit
MNWVGGGVLIFMMLLTVADVILRYLKKPILGTYELVSFLGAVVIAFALPLTTWQKGHVAVDILLENMSGLRRSMLDATTRLMGILFFTILSWNLISMGTSLYKTGEGTLTLQLPLYPIAYILGFSCVVQCLILIADLVRTVSNGGNHE